jgi:hypothetical protein
VQLDADKYRPYLDQFDMGEAEKIELLHIVSQMMRGFVDLAFGETPTQILLGIDDDFPIPAPDDEVGFPHALTDQFNQTAHTNAQNESLP